MNDTEKGLHYYKNAVIQRHNPIKPIWVPKRIVLVNTIRGDSPIGYHIVATPGEYEADCNQYGAVSIKTSNGDLLGLRLDEFDVIEWQENIKQRK